MVAQLVLWLWLTFTMAGLLCFPATAQILPPMGESSRFVHFEGKASWPKGQPINLHYEVRDKEPIDPICRAVVYKVLLEKLQAHLKSSGSFPVTWKVVAFCNVPAEGRE